MRPTRLLLGTAFAAVSAGSWAGGVAAADPTQPLVLAAVSKPVGDLLPGGSGAAQFTVTNPNAFGVRLTSVSFDRVVSSSNPAGCPVGLLSTHDQRPAGGLPVPASGTVSFAVPGALTLSQDATDECLGVTFVVAAHAEGTQDGGGVDATPPADTGAVAPGETGGPGSGSTGEPAATIPTGTGKLAFTGVPAFALAALGLAAVAAGVALRTSGRRRTREVRR
ncbi:hypothetical protein F0L68_12215 [Solihabitans fulvus]|uniref:Uncharacterized protein n=1 Tax=Solihabitans fulvus TaxID=1892852 RepID=A0A5B2XHX2_9PSEU|nr:hypothetical protein [Solihabitans fulvus]KAA2262655.1 hypothetical protein F0L68_12215 [Solihabitans fulvus]